MLYVFFWVIPQRLNFISRRFGTLYLFHLYRQEGDYSICPIFIGKKVIMHLLAYEDGTDSVFQNVGL
jgi:hypothetical protein